MANHLSWQGLSQAHWFIVCCGQAWTTEQAAANAAAEGGAEAESKGRKGLKKKGPPKLDESVRWGSSPAVLCRITWCQHLDPTC